MSAAAATVVASLALAAVLVLGLVLALLLRRIDVLTRANIDRKWDVVLLRAEVGALRRRLRAVAGTSPDDPETDVDGPQGTDGGTDTGLDADDEPDGAEGDPDDPDSDDRPGGRRTASPPAWRRDRGRSRGGRPRRRRPA